MMFTRHFLNTLTRRSAALIGTFVAVMILSAWGVLQFRSDAATQSVGYSVYFRLNDTSAPVTTEISELEPGDIIHVYSSVGNKTEGNTINDLQVYAPFAPDGIFTWIEANDDINDRSKSNTDPKIELDPSYRLEYKRGSTRTAVNASGEWVMSDVPDNQYAESPVFSDSDDTNVGFHWENLQGGTNVLGEYAYIVKYELEVKSNNVAEFNSHSTDEKTLQVRRRGESEWRIGLNGVETGDILEFKVSAHNTTRGTQAHNTWVGITNWSEDKLQNHNITGFVDASNANRVESSISLTDDKEFSLDYLENSTRFQGRPTVFAQAYDPNQVRPDGITTSNGVQLSEENGAVDGCWDFRVAAYFQARVEEKTEATPSPSPSASPSPSPSASPTASPSPSASPTPTPKPGTGFVIEKYEDYDGDGHRDSGEPGLDWKFEWKRDEESDWHDYETYAKHNGRGGNIGGLKDGETIMIREIEQSGWKVTTNKEVSVEMDKHKYKVIRFGNQRTKPSTTTSTPPKQLPQTGSNGQNGLAVAVSFGMIGLGLSWMRRQILS